MTLDDDIRTAITRDRGGPHAQLLMRIAAERDGMKADLATAHALCDQAGERLSALSDKYRAVVEQCADALVRVSALEIERDALRAELDALSSPSPFAPPTAECKAWAEQAAKGIPDPTLQDILSALDDAAANARIIEPYRRLMALSADRLRAMQWRPVTGGLPPEGDRVIVSVDDEIRLGSAFGGMMLADDGDGATHWMPPPPTTVGRAMSTRVSSVSGTTWPSRRIWCLMSGPKRHSNAAPDPNHPRSQGDRIWLPAIIPSH